MSLWSREELRIVLCPDQLILLKTRATRTLLGRRRRVLDKRIVPCAMQPDDTTAWHAATTALDAVLPEFSPTEALTTVVLSNHFVRYAMLPWNEALNSDAEEHVYAEHVFREIYGESAEGWELRISPNQAGKPQLASAVDNRLLASLRQLELRNPLRLASIQPLLMLAFNQSLSLLAGRDAWLVIVEQNYLCVVLLRKGQWSWVRTLRVGDDWARGLADMLDREAFLANADPLTRDVFVSSPAGEEFPDSVRWHIQPLRPNYLPGLEAERDRTFALYLSR